MGVTTQKNVGNRKVPIQCPPWKKAQPDVKNATKPLSHSFLHPLDDDLRGTVWISNGRIGRNGTSLYWTTIPVHTSFGLWINVWSRTLSLCSSTKTGQAAASTITSVGPSSSKAHVSSCKRLWLQVPINHLQRKDSQSLLHRFALRPPKSLVQLRILLLQ